MATKKQNDFETPVLAAPALIDQLEDANRPERCVLSAEAWNVRALDLAGFARTDCEQADQRLSKLRPSPEIDPVLKFLAALERHYSTPRACTVPLDGDAHSFAAVYFAANVTPQAVLASAFNLDLKLLHLSAIAALRATRNAPQVFAGGCAGVEEHAQHIEGLKEQLRDLYMQAANALDYERDVEFKDGIATYRMSHGAVRIGTGKGDGVAVEALVHWLRSRSEQTKTQASQEVAA